LGVDHSRIVSNGSLGTLVTINRAAISGYTVMEAEKTMSKIDYRNVEKLPGVCGGRAVVAGTRIRVSIVLGCTRLGMSIDEILQAYPQLSRSDVHDALAYAYEHLDEIEADIADDDEDAAQLRWPGGKHKP
jgi:uncharacterized protein (DUF433 family)